MFLKYLNIMFNWSRYNGIYFFFSRLKFDIKNNEDLLSNPIDGEDIESTKNSKRLFRSCVNESIMKINRKNMIYSL